NRPSRSMAISRSISARARPPVFFEGGSDQIFDYPIAQLAAATRLEHMVARTLDILFQARRIGQVPDFVRLVILALPVALIDTVTAALKIDAGSQRPEFDVEASTRLE